MSVGENLGELWLRALQKAGYGVYDTVIEFSFYICSDPDRSMLQKLPHPVCLPGGQLKAKDGVAQILLSQAFPEAGIIYILPGPDAGV